MRTVNVVVADDQAEVRSALRLVIEQLVGYRLTGEAACAEELLATTGEPHVVLLDWELPETAWGRPVTSMDAMRRLRELSPEVKVVVLSARYGARDEALAAGADGFVSKGEPPRKLIEVLDALW